MDPETLQFQFMHIHPRRREEKKGIGSQQQWRREKNSSCTGQNTDPIQNYPDTRMTVDQQRIFTSMPIKKKGGTKVRKSTRHLHMRIFSPLLLPFLNPRRRVERVQKERIKPQVKKRSYTHAHAQLESMKSLLPHSPNSRKIAGSSDELRGRVCSMRATLQPDTADKSRPAMQC